MVLGSELEKKWHRWLQEKGKNDINLQVAVDFGGKVQYFATGFVLSSLPGMNK